MKLSKQTVDILKCFSTITGNLTVKPGKVLETMSTAKDIYSRADIAEEFIKPFAIFNLNEFLAVHGAFVDPDIVFEDNFCVFKEGVKTVKYVYADPSLLAPLPKDGIKMAQVDVTFKLAAADLETLKKMAGILQVPDLSFIANDKKIIARVHSLENDSGNKFDIDLNVETTDVFNVKFDIEKIKLLPGDHTVSISSKKISLFENGAFNAKTYIAIKSDSTFGTV